MRTAQEIINEHTEEDGSVDLKACMEIFQETVAQLELHPIEHISVQEQHFSWALRWLADLVLKGLNEVGALPNGVEAERRNVAVALQFDKLRRLYDLAAAKRTPKIEVPRGLNPKDLK